MPKATETLRLPQVSPGTARSLPVLRYGTPGARPKAYLQAAIHADEVPALLVAHHLEGRLDVLDAAGAIAGEFVLVPYANPIGLSQFLLAAHQGRFELDSGKNFNRGYPELAGRVGDRVAGALGSNPAANVAGIRAALRDALADAIANGGPRDENAALKLELYRRACDADIVLDLHCDHEALLHLYVPTAQWPAAADLASLLDAQVTLLSDDAGGAAFDEACSGLWTTLARRFPQHPIPAACLGATVELHGERDVDDALAAVDADNLLRFLAARGVIDAKHRAAKSLRGGSVRSKPLAAPLDAVDIVNAPAGGILTWKRHLGARVRKDELIGEIVVPGRQAREPVIARTAGLLFARRGSRWVRPGQMVAKVAGKKPLAWRRAGALLFD